MKKLRVLGALFLISAFLAQSAWAATSTVNPNVPAQNSALSSSVLRNNFLAAYNDINSIFASVSVGSNQVLGGIAPGLATPLAIPSCSGPNNALKWTAGTGFGCNTITAGASGAAGGDLGGTYPNPAVLSLASVTSGAPGSTGSPLINNGGALYGAPLVTFSPTNTPDSYNNGDLPPKALEALSSGLFVDPRAHGAQCTGWYGLLSASVSAGGSGWAVGDKFIVMDDNLQNEGVIALPATGHVSAVSGGAATAVVIDTPGANYNGGSIIFVTPITGTGANLSITATSVQGGHPAPTLTMTSGGGGSTTPLAGYAHMAAGSYAVGDLFAIPNSTLDGNYVVGRVDSVTSTKAVATYHLYNFGGDYAIASGVQAITLTGIGRGLTFDITSNTVAGTTFDDTYGLVKGTIAARTAGGSLLLPDNCWTQTWPMVNGAVVVGSNGAPAYGYRLFWQVGNVDVSGFNRAPKLNIIHTPSTYAIDLNGSNGGYLYGFRIIPRTGITFGASTTWDTTIAIGNSTVDPYGTGGNGAGGQAAWMLEKMSASYFKYAVGTQSGAGPLTFIKLRDNDWSGNNLGAVYGALSDFVQENDTMSSLNGYCVEVTAGGGSRIGPNNRCEYAKGGWKFSNFGALEGNLWNNQGTALQECGIYASNTQGISAIGNQFSSVGLGGTLTVTGAANNGSGLIRLTVTGIGGPNCSSGGSVCPTIDLVTGDKANVQGVVGTTEANGNQWTITKVDGTHIDLQGSTFTNAYVSGGSVGVNGKGAAICLDTVNNFTATGNTIFGYGSGFFSPPAFILDTVGSTGINFIGSRMTNEAANLGSYKQSFGNYHNAGNTKPANVNIDVQGNPPFRNDNTTLSINDNGALGLGTTSAAAGVGFDMLGRTTSVNSTIGLPHHTTANRPTTPLSGMFALNDTSTALEFYAGSAWRFLPSVTSTAPQAGYLLSSLTTGGTNGEWVAPPSSLPSQAGQGGNYLTTDGTTASWAAVTTTASTALGTSVTGANPQISGDNTSGFYTAGAGLIDVAIAGVKVVEWASTGQTVTGTSTANSFIPTSSSLPTDGLYLSAANTPAIAARSLTALSLTNPASAVNYITITGAATGAAPTISNAGSDASGAGLGLNLSGRTGNTGGGITITGGTGSGGAAAGGAVAITGGTGAGGAPGVVNITGGNSQSGTAGGIVTVRGGPSSSGAGGVATVIGGIPTAGNGGAANLIGSNGVSGNTTGGAANVTGGNSVGSGAGAAANVTGGNGGATGAGGNAVITSGNGGATSGVAGSINLNLGSTTSSAGGNLPTINFGGGIVSKGTKFTTTGCSISATTGGANAGTFTLGANSCTAVITPNGAAGSTAPNGWSCWASDLTDPTQDIRLASSTATTASFAIPAGAGATDVINFGCIGF